MEAKVMEYLRRLSNDQRLAPTAWENSTLSQKRLTLIDLIKEIRYDGGTSILEIVLNSSQKSHAFNVTKAELKYRPVTPSERLIKSEPQLRQNLLLAHQIQQLIDNNKAKDIKEVSGWLNLSQQRVNQIVSLLFLSPRIQEAIILQNEPCFFEIPEYKLRNITDELDWDKQHTMWQKLTQKRV
jgi:hypothetical protein